MNAIARNPISRKLVLAVLAIFIFTGAALNPAAAEAAGSTAVDTHTTCSPGAMHSTMTIAGGRGQTVGARFYVQKYNFSTARWEEDSWSAWEVFELPYIDPIDNSVGQGQVKITFKGVTRGYYVVWAHVWYKDARGYWTNETWVLPDTVDYYVNGQYSTSTEQWCHFT